MNSVTNFFTKYGLYILIAAVLIGVAVYYIVINTTNVPKKVGKMLPLNTHAVDSNEFEFLDRTRGQVVPITTPTDNQNYTKHIASNGSVVYEPNLVMDPVDILGQEEFDMAIDSIHPGVSESQLKRLTTPWILKQGSVFWGTHYPPGGPGTEKFCIKESDLLHKGVFSSHSSCGTTDEGTSCNIDRSCNYDF